MRVVQPAPSTELTPTCRQCISARSDLPTVYFCPLRLADSVFLPIGAASTQLRLADNVSLPIGAASTQLRLADNVFLPIADETL